jgi:hypothetical protein
MDPVASDTPAFPDGWEAPAAAEWTPDDMPNARPLITAVAMVPLMAAGFWAGVVITFRFILGEPAPSVIEWLLR